MIEPQFDISQDDEFVSLRIKCPHIRTQEVEFVVLDNQFKIFAKPYYLSLELPGRIVEDGRESATYDCTSGIIDVKLPKETLGEDFPNLHMLTTLLSKKVQPPKKKGVLIEEVEMSGYVVAEEWYVVPENWPLSRELPSEDSLTVSDVKYGFAKQHCEFFLGMEELGRLMEVLRINPDKDQDSRQQLFEMEELENQASFDEEVFLCSVADETERILEQKFWFNKTIGSLSLEEKKKPCEFTQKEKDLMMSLPRKSYLFDSAEDVQIHIESLLSILYAYAYVYRTNDGELPLEASYSVISLSPTLCYFAHPRDLKSLLVTLAKRTLCYPLYRNLSIYRECLQDVSDILNGGSSVVLRCILELVEYFRMEDDLWRIGKVWIEDYASWLQDHRVEPLLLKVGETLEVGLQGKNDLLPKAEDIELAGWNIQGLMNILNQEDSDTECSSSSDFDDDSSEESTYTSDDD